DWEFWMSEDSAAKAQSNEMMKNYFANVRKVYAGIESKVTKYEWDKEVMPGITSVAAPGHTPGHTAFVIASGSSTILLQSDVTNIPEFFLRNPACGLRRRSGAGANDPAQVLRHGVGRKGAGGGLPLQLPVDGPRREGRRQIPPGSDRVESGYLIAAIEFDIRFASGDGAPLWLHRDDALNLDRDLVGQHHIADSRASMAAGVAEYLDEQIGTAVDDFRRVVEIRYRVDHAEQL